MGIRFYRNGNVLKRHACLVDKYVPTKIVKPGVPDKPPWTKFKSVKKAKKKCRQSEISYKQSGLNADKLLMEADKNSLVDTLRRAKGDYEISLADSLEDNPKRFFNYARNFNKTSATLEVLEILRA